MISAPQKAATPPVMCTTPDPAKSMTPPMTEFSLKEDAQPCPSHTWVANAGGIGRPWNRATLEAAGWLEPPRERLGAQGSGWVPSGPASLTLDVLSRPEPSGAAVGGVVA